MSNATQSLAGKRITSLLDANSFVENGQSVTARSTDFNLAEKKHLLTELLPDMVSLTGIWFMYTARMYPY